MKGVHLMAKKKKIKRVTLAPIREKFRKLVDKANALYSEVSEKHPGAISLYDANRTMSKRNQIAFDLDNAKRFREIRREVRRAEQFIRDYDAEVGQLEPDPSRWAGKFGNQYTKEYGKSYSPDLNDDVAKMAFEAYRRVESDLAAQIEAFGSDILIQYLYDYIIINPSLYFMDDKMRIEKIKLDAQEFLVNKYKENIQRARGELVDQREYGILQSSKTARDFAKAIKW